LKRSVRTTKGSSEKHKTGNKEQMVREPAMTNLEKVLEVGVGITGEGFDRATASASACWLLSARWLWNWPDAADQLGGLQ
jgi:hypothetical protein